MRFILTVNLINATSNDTFNIQRVDGSTLYASLELSFNSVDKASILKLHNIDILQSINNEESSTGGYNKTDIDIGLNLTSDQFNTYWKSDVAVFVSSLQAGIDRRVLISAFDINGRFNNAITNDILKIKKVDGALAYDVLEVSFNTVEKTSILKLNNVDMLSTLNFKASASNVYTKQDINNHDFMYANALNTKADKSTSFTKKNIHKGINWNTIYFCCSSSKKCNDYNWNIYN